MDRVLIDSSTLFDISRGLKKRNEPWAQNTFAKLSAYHRYHSKLTISSFTLFEQLEGLYRSGNPHAATNFHQNVLPTYEIIRPDLAIEDKAAEIHARLRQAGQGIGVSDTFIAATAITHQLTLVNANTRHFPRVVAAGFPLKIENWRDA